MQIKVDDMVEIVTGDDKGQRGRVLRVDRSAGKMVVEGINLVYKHVRKSQRNPQGGRLSKEMPIQFSNAMLVCEKCNQRTRVGLRFESDGSKIRYCKKCGTTIGQVAPPKAAHAQS